MTPSPAGPGRTGTADPPVPPRPAGMLWAAVGMLAVFGLLGIVGATVPVLGAVDDWWRLLVGTAPGGTAASAVVPMFFQYLGQAPGTVGLLLLLPLALAAFGRWRSGLFVASAGAFTIGALSQGMKDLADRPRPAADAALGLYGPLVGVDHGSYPSGHVVTAAFAAVAIAALFPPHPGSARTIWWVVGVFLIVGMVWQRTLVNAHWLSDAVFGALAGAGGALLMWWLFWPWLHRDYARPLAPFGRAARRTGSPAHAAL